VKAWERLGMGSPSELDLGHVTALLGCRHLVTIGLAMDEARAPQPRRAAAAQASAIGARLQRLSAAASNRRSAALRSSFTWA
jgi:hypothetical protein